MTLLSRIALLVSLASCAASAAFAADAPPRWNKDDIATMCHARFGDDDRAHSYKDCIKRNHKKIGHDEAPADVQELEADRAGGTK